MSSDLTLGGAALTLRVSPRARRLRLKVDPRTRTVILTVPRRVAQRRALAWAAEQQIWVEEELAKLPPVTLIEPGAVIPLRGEPHRIDWQSAYLRRVEQSNGCLNVGGPEENLEARIIRWLKAQAFELLAAETRELAARAGRPVHRIGVGDPTSRWGSCSSSGTIRYSWRLLLAPDFVRRATVAHEVAHLFHFDHSPSFHAIAAELLGSDPAPARLWLRREGSTLHRIGGRGAV